ncbi:MAG: DUF6786 family protein [Pirellulaceae bacterium]
MILNTNRGRRAIVESVFVACVLSIHLVLVPTWSVADDSPNIDASPEKNFGEDVLFLKKHAPTIVLQSADGGAQVAIVPAYQGRVMTSSASGSSGTSFGWINYEHITSGKIAPQINVYGGEERFWLGPEGGQFSIFFQPGAKFEFADWATPALIDTEPFDVASQDDRSVAFRKLATLTNYSKTVFQLSIERRIELIDATNARNSLQLDVASDGVRLVGYRTSNKLTNTGNKAWTKETGLLSIWLLGMYKPGPATTVVIPYRHNKDFAESSAVVNDTYFGKVPAERLKVSQGHIFFSGDGTFRSKIGVPPRVATDVCGSYDAARKVLTIVKFNQPERGVTDYVNSMWELQDRPFAGDVVNAYNDGAPTPGGKPLGPFYELETSSPALALGPSQSAEHIQETYHFEGDIEQLDVISKKVLGVSLQTIEQSLK